MSVPRAQAKVNLAAIERNCARLLAELGDGARLCAVVKADGYGHGSLASARAALAAGASMLAVADASEARELRDGGLVEAPLLVMGPLAQRELAEALGAGAEVIVWSLAQLEEVAARGGGRVHVKLDSGMGRLGTRDLDEASAVVRRVRETKGVELAGVMTHFATADDLADGGFFAEQLHRFAHWAESVKAESPDVVVHAANSAAMLRDPAAQFDMVRCGIAIYGMDPFGRDPAARGLEPALELSSRIAEVKLCRAGETVGYGRRFRAEHDTHVAVLPIGYGDGWRRGLSNNADALIGGLRHPLVGTVSMDSVTADIGPDAGGRELVGGTAILIGFQGSERITAEELARRIETINYEITCGLTARVPRVYHRDGEPLEEPVALGRDGAPSGAP